MSSKPSSYEDLVKRLLTIGLDLESRRRILDGEMDRFKEKKDQLESLDKEDKILIEQVRKEKDYWYKQALQSMFVCVELTKSYNELSKQASNQDGK
jgi:hypothetical protein